MNKKSENIRFGILAGALAVVFILFSFTLVNIQITKGEYYRNKATAVTEVRQHIPAVRGEIVDRYGRPFTTNRVGYDIVFDKAFMPGSTIHSTILKLVSIMEKTDVEWIDMLPITRTEPFMFIEGRENDVRKLKRALSVNEYAGAEECLYWLADEKFYNLTYENEEGEKVFYPPEQLRILAGIRYSMAQSDFSAENIYVFAHDVGTALRDIIEEQNAALPGVKIMETPIREYVDGTLAPHILGITGPIYKEDMDRLKEDGLWISKDNPFGYRANEELGKSGIEYAMESELRGKSGERIITIDPHGKVVDSRESIPPVPGNTVVLTLDRDLQAAAQDALASTIEDYRATEGLSHENGHDSKAGAVVVQDPKTGEILAMANYPTYDINNYNKDFNELSQMKPEPLLNRATMGLYRPGSIYKPAMAIGGLTEHVITENEKINCTGVYTRFPDYPARCMHVDGPIDVKTALQRSCNIFFYETGWRLGIERQNQYSKALGLGQKTGLEISEAQGRFSCPETKEAYGEAWTNGNVIQSAIGQLDHAFTPVQMANYVSTLACDGVRHRSHLVREIKSYDFKDTIKVIEPEILNTVTAAPGAYEAVREGMIRATQPGGTSWWLWQGFPLTVASKTGSPENGDKLNSTYICYIPAEDPQIAISVVIEDGGQGYTGAPVARKIAESFFANSSEIEKIVESNTIIP